MEWSEFVTWWQKGSFSRSDFLAIVAIALSIVTATIQFIFGRSQHALNNMQIAERKAAERAAKQAQLFASIKKKMPNVYYLEVENVGRSEAWNVNVETNEKSEALFPKGSREKILPFKVLGPGKAFRIVIAIYLETESIQTIKLTWKDHTGERQDEIVMDVSGASLIGHQPT